MTGTSPDISRTGRPALKTDNLDVGYVVRREHQVVLGKLSLSVKPGELVALLGPNGVGKSTMLRTLSGIQKPLAGTVTIDGIDLRRMNQLELAKRLGVVLTERAIAAALPAYRVVELGRYPHLGWSGKLASRDLEVVRAAMDAVGISHLAGRDSSKLSDGERQRLMIARALAQEPLILLLDEPTAFLDVPSRVELMGLLCELARSKALAVIVSTHDLELALRMADTVWLVAGGRVLVGAPEDIVMSGEIASAFASENIQFHPEERTFRLNSSVSGRAIVSGHGLPATLASAVLERVGYEVVAERPASVAVTVGTGRPLWRAAAGERSAFGDNFGTLAQFVRSVGQAERGAAELNRATQNSAKEQRSARS